MFIDAGATFANTAKSSVDAAAKSGVIFGFVGGIIRYKLILPLYNKYYNSGGAMSFLWSMISCLQMILYLPLMKVNMPNLTANIFLALSISSFNFLPL